MPLQPDQPANSERWRPLSDWQRENIFANRRRTGEFQLESEGQGYTGVRNNSRESARLVESKPPVQHIEQLYRNTAPGCQGQPGQELLSQEEVTLNNSHNEKLRDSELPGKQDAQKTSEHSQGLRQRWPNQSQFLASMAEQVSSLEEKLYRPLSASLARGRWAGEDMSSPTKQRHNSNIGPRIIFKDNPSETGFKDAFGRQVEADLYSQCLHHIQVINACTELQQGIKDEMKKQAKLDHMINRKMLAKAERLQNLISSVESSNVPGWVPQAFQELQEHVSQQAQAHYVYVTVLTTQCTAIQHSLDGHQELMKSVLGLTSEAKTAPSEEREAIDFDADRMSFLQASNAFEEIRKPRIRLSNKLEYMQSQMEATLKQLEEVENKIENLKKTDEEVTTLFKLEDSQIRAEFLKSHYEKLQSEVKFVQLELSDLDFSHRDKLLEILNIFHQHRVRYDAALRKCFQLLSAVSLRDNIFTKELLKLGADQFTQLAQGDSQQTVADDEEKSLNTTQELADTGFHRKYSPIAVRKTTQITSQVPLRSTNPFVSDPYEGVRLQEMSTSSDSYTRTEQSSVGASQLSKYRPAATGGYSDINFSRARATPSETNMVDSDQGQQHVQGHLNTSADGQADIRQMNDVTATPTSDVAQITNVENRNINSASNVPQEGADRADRKLWAASSHVPAASQTVQESEAGLIWKYGHDSTSSSDVRNSYWNQTADVYDSRLQLTNESRVTELIQKYAKSKVPRRFCFGTNYNNCVTTSDPTVDTGLEHEDRLEFVVTSDHTSRTVKICAVKPIYSDQEVSTEDDMKEGEMAPPDPHRESALLQRRYASLREFEITAGLYTVPKDSTSNRTSVRNTYCSHNTNKSDKQNKTDYFHQRNSKNDEQQNKTIDHQALEEDEETLVKTLYPSGNMPHTRPGQIVGPADTGTVQDSYELYQLFDTVEGKESKDLYYSKPPNFPNKKPLKSNLKRDNRTCNPELLADSRMSDDMRVTLYELRTEADRFVKATKKVRFDDRVHFNDHTVRIDDLAQLNLQQMEWDALKAESSQLQHQDLQMLKSSQIQHQDLQMLKSSQIQHQDLQMLKSSQLQHQDLQMLKSNQLQHQDLQMLKSSQLQHQDLQMLNVSHVCPDIAASANNSNNNISHVYPSQRPWYGNRQHFSVSAETSTKILVKSARVKHVMETLPVFGNKTRSFLSLNWQVQFYFVKPPCGRISGAPGCFLCSPGYKKRNELRVLDGVHEFRCAALVPSHRTWSTSLVNINYYQHRCLHHEEPRDSLNHNNNSNNNAVESRIISIPDGTSNSHALHDDMDVASGSLHKSMRRGRRLERNRRRSPSSAASISSPSGCTRAGHRARSYPKPQHSNWAGKSKQTDSFQRLKAPAETREASKACDTRYRQGARDTRLKSGTAEKSFQRQPSPSCQPNTPRILTQKHNEPNTPRIMNTQRLHSNTHSPINFLLNHLNHPKNRLTRTVSNATISSVHAGQNVFIKTKQGPPGVGLSPPVNATLHRPWSSISHVISFSTPRSRTPAPPYHSPKGLHLGPDDQPPDKRLDAPTCLTTDQLLRYNCTPEREKPKSHATPSPSRDPPHKSPAKRSPKSLFSVLRTFSCQKAALQLAAQGNRSCNKSDKDLMAKIARDERQDASTTPTSAPSTSDSRRIPATSPNTRKPSLMAPLSREPARSFGRVTSDQPAREFGHAEVKRVLQRNMSQRFGLTTKVGPVRVAPLPQPLGRARGYLSAFNSGSPPLPAHSTDSQDTPSRTGVKKFADEPSRVYSDLTNKQLCGILELGGLSGRADRYSGESLFKPATFNTKPTSRDGMRSASFKASPPSDTETRGFRSPSHLTEVESIIQRVHANSGNKSGRGYQPSSLPSTLKLDGTRTHPTHPVSMSEESRPRRQINKIVDEARSVQENLKHLLSFKSSSALYRAACSIDPPHFGKADNLQAKSSITLTNAKNKREGLPCGLELCSARFPRSPNIARDAVSLLKGSAVKKLALDENKAVVRNFSEQYELYCEHGCAFLRMPGDTFDLSLEDSICHKNSLSTPAQASIGKEGTEGLGFGNDTKILNKFRYSYKQSSAVPLENTHAPSLSKDELTSTHLLELKKELNEELSKEIKKELQEEFKDCSDAVVGDRSTLYFGESPDLLYPEDPGLRDIASWACQPVSKPACQPVSQPSVQPVHKLLSDSHVTGTESVVASDKPSRFVDHQGRLDVIMALPKMCSSGDVSIVKPSQSNAKDSIAKPSQSNANDCIAKPSQSNANDCIAKPSQINANDSIVKLPQSKANDCIVNQPQSDANGSIVKLPQSNANDGIVKLPQSGVGDVFAAKPPQCTARATCDNQTNKNIPPEEDTTQYRHKGTLAAEDTPTKVTISDFGKSEEEDCAKDIPEDVYTHLEATHVRMGIVDEQVLQGDHKGQLEVGSESDHQGQLEVGSESDHQGQLEAGSESDHQGQLEAGSDSYHQGQLEAGFDSDHQGQSEAGSDSDHDIEEKEYVDEIATVYENNIDEKDKNKHENTMDERTIDGESPKILGMKLTSGNTREDNTQETSPSPQKTPDATNSEQAPPQAIKTEQAPPQSIRAEPAPPQAIRAEQAPPQAIRTKKSAIEKLAEDTEAANCRVADTLRLGQKSISELLKNAMAAKFSNKPKMGVEIVEKKETKKKYLAILSGNQSNKAQKRDQSAFPYTSAKSNKKKDSFGQRKLAETKPPSPKKTTAPPSKKHEGHVKSSRVRQLAEKSRKSQLEKKQVEINMKQVHNTGKRPGLLAGIKKNLITSLHRQQQTSLPSVKDRKIPAQGRRSSWAREETLPRQWSDVTRLSSRETVTDIESAQDTLELVESESETDVRLIPLDNLRLSLMLHDGKIVPPVQKSKPRPTSGRVHGKPSGVQEYNVPVLQHSSDLRPPSGRVHGKPSGVQEKVPALPHSSELRPPSGRVHGKPSGVQEKVPALPHSSELRPPSGRVHGKPSGVQENVPALQHSSELRPPSGRVHGKPSGVQNDKVAPVPHNSAPYPSPQSLRDKNGIKNLMNELLISPAGTGTETVKPTLRKSKSASAPYMKRADRVLDFRNKYVLGFSDKDISKDIRPLRKCNSATDLEKFFAEKLNPTNKPLKIEIQMPKVEQVYSSSKSTTSYFIKSPPKNFTDTGVSEEKERAKPGHLFVEPNKPDTSTSIRLDALSSRSRHNTNFPLISARIESRSILSLSTKSCWQSSRPALHDVSLELPELDYQPVYEGRVSSEHLKKAISDSRNIAVLEEKQEQGKYIKVIRYSKSTQRRYEITYHTKTNLFFGKGKPFAENNTVYESELHPHRSDESANIESSEHRQEKAKLSYIKFYNKLLENRSATGFRQLQPRGVVPPKRRELGARVPKDRLLCGIQKRGISCHETDNRQQTKSLSKSAWRVKSVPDTAITRHTVASAAKDLRLTMNKEDGSLSKHRHFSNSHIEGMQQSVYNTHSSKSSKQSAAPPADKKNLETKPSQQENTVDGQLSEVQQLLPALEINKAQTEMPRRGIRRNFSSFFTNKSQNNSIGFIGAKQCQASSNPPSVFIEKISDAKNIWECK
ncbi:uncharacterized protein LOC131937361 [Physella acuta]|uniref:uncharacterized protein LOC131937361 n=1 Tax=Physella acuta TaxID=109671 RepID=UPI0027DDFD2A|nr:uncharacterized protein LOC131937361 [Physella acuta]